MPRNIRILFIQQFFEGVVPIQALYAIMFSRVGGLNFQQISFLFAIWSLSYLVAELPSGILADYWSRKKVIILGGLLRGFGFLVWLLYPHFLGYAVGFALWGFTIACSSGASTAFLHSELSYENRSSQFARYLGRLKSFYWSGVLTGFLVSAILTLRHTNTLLLMSIGASWMYSFILTLATEHPYKKQNTYLQTLFSAFREVRHSKKLRYICTVLFSVYMVIGVLEELFPRIYAHFGLSDTIIALIAALSMLSVVLLLTRLEKFVHISYASQVFILCANIGLFMVGVALGKKYATILILLFSLGFQFFRPVFEHHLQDSAKGDERATIGSIPGLAGGLLGAFAYVVMGKISSASSENFSMIAYALFWLGVLFILAVIGKMHNFSSKPEIKETVL